MERKGQKNLKETLGKDFKSYSHEKSPTEQHYEKFCLDQLQHLYRIKQSGIGMN